MPKQSRDRFTWITVRDDKTSVIPGRVKRGPGIQGESMVSIESLKNNFRQDLHDLQDMAHALKS